MITRAALSQREDAAANMIQKRTMTIAKGTTPHKLMRKKAMTTTLGPRGKLPRQYDDGEDLDKLLK